MNTRDRLQIIFLPPLVVGWIVSSLYIVHIPIIPPQLTPEEFKSLEQGVMVSNKMYLDESKLQTFLEEVLQYPNPTYYKVCLENWNIVPWNDVGIDINNQANIRILSSSPFFSESAAMGMKIESGTDAIIYLYAKINRHDCKNLTLTKDTKLKFSGEYLLSYSIADLEKPLLPDTSRSRFYIYPRYFPGVAAIFIIILVAWCSLVQLFMSTYKYIRTGE